MGVVQHEQSKYSNSAPVAAQLMTPSKLQLYPSPPLLAEQYDLELTVRKTLQGSVLLMRHNVTGKKVAVKTASKKLVASKVSAKGVSIGEDIVKEVQLLRLLSATPCANMIQMVDYLEDDKQHALVLEYATGGELFDWIERHGPCPEPQARNQLMRGIFTGLSFMHERGVCHLDLSPENILLMEDGTPKLCDLGLARFYQPGHQFRGNPSSRPGKLTYMSPEVYSGSDFYGPSADIWSLGVLMFVVMFGFPPFEIANTSDQRYKFLMKHGLCALLAEWNLESTVSSAACDLLARMLQPETQRITLPGIMRHPWITGDKSKC